MDLSETQCDIAPALEEWRAVPGYEGRYEVSDQGRVRSLLRNRELKPCFSHDGYKKVMVYAGGVGRNRKQVCIHSLVALAWIGPKHDGLRVDHIDMVKENNRPCNLRYVTARQSAQNRRVPKRGDGVYSAKYIGIAKRGNVFQARIHLAGKRIHLGYFGTQEEAGLAYDKAAIAAYGNFAVVNFPEACK